MTERDDGEAMGDDWKVGGGREDEDALSSHISKNK